MAGFFDQPVEQQIRAAIDRSDPKLVQILLGTKYCQLWQYWLAHAMISYNMLAIERATQCNLPLEIIEEQKVALEKSLKLFQSRKEVLERASRDNEQAAPLSTEERNSLDMKAVMSVLFKVTTDTIKNYKDLVEKENVPGTNYLYCTPNEHVATENNCRDVVLSHYTANVLRNVNSEMQSSFIEECSGAIDDMEKIIVGDVWEQTNLSTKTSYYLNEISNFIGGENGRTLDEATNYMPSNYQRAIRLVLGWCRPLVNGVRTLNDGIYNNPDKLKCVNNKITEIGGIVNNLNATQKEKSRLKEQLGESRRKVKEGAVDKITDGELFDKEFVKTMHEKLFDNYLLKASEEKSGSLLYETIEEKRKNTKTWKENIKAQILNNAKGVDIDLITKLLEYAIQKGNDANVEVISVLILNITNQPSLCEHLLTNCPNEEVKGLIKQSNNTIMINVHNALFDFNNEVVNLVSVFPTKTGDFSRETTENKIILKKMGGEKHQKMLEKIGKLKDELDKKRKVGQDKERPHEWKVFSLFYNICDFIYQGLSEEQYSAACSQSAELHRRASYSAIFRDEGIMRDYVKKMQNNPEVDGRVKKHCNSLYRTASDQSWKEPPEEYTLSKFLTDNKRMAEELEKRELKQKDEEIATQRAEKEKEARRRQEAEKGKQEAEQKAETLAEALRKAGIDPDTVLQSVNVSQGASSGMGGR